MALRLGSLVLLGEIDNTRVNSVTGWLLLAGRDDRLPLHLTGNCSPDLFGKHIRFEARQPSQDVEPVDIDDLANQQIGPTGIITAARKIQHFDEDPGNVYIRSKLGEPPPVSWKRSLYVEWFSQNGRVVVELVDPIMEYVEVEAEDDDADDGLDVEVRVAGADDEPEQDDDWPDGSADDDPDAEFDDDEPPDDPFGLFPDELAQQFEEQAAQTDQFISPADEESSDVLRELKLMDDLLESGQDVPVGSIFDPPIRLARPDQLDDQQVETALKSLLARLAQYGIALDMCEHYSPRDAYRLLVEHICTEEGAFPQLRHTQWVQHFMTHDFCEQCEAEFNEGEEEDGEAEDGEADTR